MNKVLIAIVLTFAFIGALALGEMGKTKLGFSTASKAEQLTCYNGGVTVYQAAIVALRVTNGRINVQEPSGTVRTIYNGMCVSTTKQKAE